MEKVKFNSLWDLRLTGGRSGTASTTKNSSNLLSQKKKAALLHPTRLFFFLSFSLLAFKLRLVLKCLCFYLGKWLVFWQLVCLGNSWAAARLTRASGQKLKVCRQEGDMAGASPGEEYWLLGQMLTQLWGWGIWVQVPAYVVWPLLWRTEKQADV